MQIKGPSFSPDTRDRDGPEINLASGLSWRNNFFLFFFCQSSLTLLLRKERLQCSPEIILILHLHCPPSIPWPESILVHPRAFLDSDQSSKCSGYEYYRWIKKGCCRCFFFKKKRRYLL
jgi:hypothetical protein